MKKLNKKTEKLIDAEIPILWDMLAEFDKNAIWYDRKECRTKFFEKSIPVLKRIKDVL